MGDHRKLICGAAAALALLVSPVVASAQPAPPPPPPGGGAGGGAPPMLPLWHPRGLVWGVGLGLGAMSSDEGTVECFNCDFSPLAAAVQVGIGFQLGPRFQIRGELMVGAQTLDADGAAFLTQTGLFFVARYFAAPRLWVEGGIGPTALEISVDDGYLAEDIGVDKGGGAMAAVGFEVAKGRRMAISLEGRVFGAYYQDIDDTVTTGTIGVRFDFYPIPVVVVQAGPGY